MKKLKAFPQLVIIIGVIFALTGVVAVAGGAYINMFVGEQLASQNRVVGPCSGPRGGDTTHVHPPRPATSPAKR